MNYNAYFSPTDITKEITSYIANDFENAKDIDLSLKDLANYRLSKDDFLIIGTPSFGGRVPNIAKERMRKISGNHTPALLVVTYGAREYEDTLRELKDILEELGFVSIAAIAMVTKHSIVNEIASDRPNKQDYIELDNFIEVVKKRLNEEYKSIEVPGNYPYKEYKVAHINIETLDSCIDCKKCINLCPVSAINQDNPRITDEDLCVSCMRCVYVCKQNAKQANSQKVELLAKKLRLICNENKANEFF